MNAKDAIRYTLGQSEQILKRYLDGLEDADLQLRPVDGMNCIAWQLGHLLSTERDLMDRVKPGSSPDLPPGFAESHSRDNAQADNSSKYLSKDQYVSLIEAQRKATSAVLDSLSESDLDAPAPEVIRMLCPTVGAVMLLAGNHYLLHLGQFVAVRRKLEKPVAF